MTDGDLDRYLSGEPEIVPSSGFTVNVMEAVRRQAATPPPLPFPWKRALPGLAAAVAVMIFFAVMCLRTPRDVVSSIPRQLPALLDAARAAGLGWAALALALSMVAAQIAKRLSSSWGR